MTLCRDAVLFAVKQTDQVICFLCALASFRFRFLFQPISRGRGHPGELKTWGLKWRRLSDCLNSEHYESTGEIEKRGTKA